MRLRLLGSLLLTIALVPAASAQAATVSLQSDSGQVDGETGEEILSGSVSFSITDRIGEVNDITVRVEGRVVVVTDRAARLTHGKRCTSESDGGVRCVLPETDELDFGVDAGGGDDTVRMTGTDPLDAYLGGGDGADRLTGGVGPERLYGGPGVDVLRGGPGDDELTGDDPSYLGDATPPAPSPDTLDGGLGTDRVSFDQRPTGVRVDLAARTAAEDALSSIENVQGGTGDDVLLGDDGEQRFADSEGIDTVDGRGGNDAIQFAEHVHGGAGDDVLFALRAVSLACGTGVDVVALLVRLAPADCEWVFGDSDVVLGRNVLRVRGGLALRTRLGGGRGQEIRLRADGVLVGRARQPASRAKRDVRVPVRLTSAGRRLVGSGRAVTLVASSASGAARLRLPAR